MATRACLLVAVLHLCVVATSWSQIVEIELGGGHVFGGEPSVAIVEAGVIVWPLQHWGIAAHIIRGPGDGESLLRLPEVGRYLTGHLRAWTVTARYRLPTIGLEVGVGIARGDYDSSALLQPANERPRLSSSGTPRGGVALGAFYKRTLWRRVGISGGLAYDMWVEGRDYVRPVVLGVVGV